MGMLLIKNAQVYAPQELGQTDILIGGNRILHMAASIELRAGLDLEVFDATGLLVVPGLIDSHVHIAGAGGEGGPASRTSEMPLSAMYEGGVTTVIGCLGTDGITRTVESVLMKAKGLRQQGASAWIYTGSYQVPVTTILGDPGKDIALIEEIIGVGEIAISDHRSSVPTTAELIRIAAHARVGGMLGGKAGIVNVHMGDAKNPFKPIEEAVAGSELHFKQFLPTHCNRNHYIFSDALTYGKRGYVDITTSSWPYFPDEEVKPSIALKKLLEAGVPEEHITFSSDACGSLPVFDGEGRLVRIEAGLPSANLREVADAVNNEKIPLATAIKVVTSNVASILKLESKGRIATGCDADLLFLDSDLQMKHLISLGKWVVKGGSLT